MHARSRSTAWLLAGLVLVWQAFAAPAALAQGKLKYAGVNLAGAEFNSGKKPGTLFKDYTYPGASDYAYFAGQGMNIVRLPFLWERLQPTANGPLDNAQLTLIKQAVQRANDNGLIVLLDVHNYAKFNGKIVGKELPASTLADLWKRLAPVFAGNAKVMYGLMNEPNNIGSSEWAQVAQASVDAIRATGADNVIMVPGNAWTGAHSWMKAAGASPSNGDALVGLRDPKNKVIYEVHQYLDADYSGTKPECVSATVGAEKLASFTSWLRKNGKVGFLGEFGAADNPTCMAALENMLKYMQDNRDVWAGWSYWAAGPWWNQNYPFLVQPDKAGNARPQMKVLSKYARQITGR
ncbi:glycoside hydrolase family 5 protein [Pseudoxanthomonas composti]|uniref:Endoglucanase n=1 Tax=Pseudoxanthomonas composti TaxID=2137479 RepID=A0A4Q1JUZ4_9GAMM|nr:glycoside hydrolase family 5 protein [Pseudoxanthomonas composti]RXR05951.1 glycoside hydrolase family 5 protein [Pseudoxanthomonas composti]